jgi:5'-nucleotidase
MRDSLYLQDWTLDDYPGAKLAYSCSGTPADCVKIGISLMSQRGVDIDLVCSGINHGANMGTDVFYSGTVAAAMEGRLMGVPGIAFSLCAHDGEHFEAFHDIVPEIVRKSYGKIPETSILNVNVPNLPSEDIKGILVTDVGVRRFEEEYRLVQQIERGDYYEYLSLEKYYGDQGLATDIGASQQGYVTISPISIKRTYRQELVDVRSWNIRWK